jgi:hypothetical protein
MVEKRGAGHLDLDRSVPTNEHLVIHFWIVVGKPHLTSKCLSPDHVLIGPRLPTIRPLVIAAGGNIPLQWMAAKREKLRRLSGVNCSFPSTRPGSSNCRRSDGLVSRPLPLFSRCLGALLFAVIGMDRCCAKEHITLLNNGKTKSRPEGWN